MSEKPRILVVSPHPDDESFYEGGTIAKCAQNGADVHLLVLAKGEKGKISFYQGQELITTKVADEQKKLLAKFRRIECVRAANSLGLPKENIEFGQLPDSEINQNAIRIIANAMRGLDPHVIISFDEAGTSRPSLKDHSWSGIATFAAIRLLLAEKNLGSSIHNIPKPLFSFRRLLTYNLPNTANFLKEYATLNIPEEELTLVDVRDVQTKKLEACRQYKTQMRLFNDFLSIGLLTAPHEAFYERISFVPSCKGKDDILFGLDSPITSLTSTKIPEDETRFISTDPGLYKNVRQRFRIAGQIKIK